MFDGLKSVCVSCTKNSMYALCHPSALPHRCPVGDASAFQLLSLLVTLVTDTLRELEISCIQQVSFSCLLKCRFFPLSSACANS